MTLRLESWRWLALLSALISLLNVAFSQEKKVEIGRPWVRAFMPQDYGGEAHVGAVIESPWGTMLFASGRWVIEFDGSTWRRTETPITHVRAVAVDSKGRIIAAGTGDFGTLTRQPDGRWQYASLAAGLPAQDRDFGAVWQLCVVGNEVWFGSETRLFRWREPALDTWRFDGEGSCTLLQTGDEILLHHSARGLLRWTGRDFIPWCTDRRVVPDQPFGLFRTAPDVLLLVLRVGGLMRLDGTNVTFIGAPVKALPGDAWINCSCRRKDGTLLVGRDLLGAALVSPKGEVLRLFTRDDGLSDGDLVAGIEDSRGDLWFATRRGITQISRPDALSWFGERESSLDGPVEGLLRHHGSMFLSISDGMRALTEVKAGTEDRSWWGQSGLNLSDPRGLASHPSGLLVGHATGLYLRLDNATNRAARVRQLIAGERRYELLCSSTRLPGIAWAGGLNGFAAAQVSSNTAVELGHWPTVGPVTSLLETDDGTVLIGTRHGRLWQWNPVGAAEFSKQQPVEIPLPITLAPDAELHLQAVPGGVSLETPVGQLRREPLTGRWRPEDRFVAQGLVISRLTACWTVDSNSAWASVVPATNSPALLGELRRTAAETFEFHPLPAPVQDVLGPGGATMLWFDGSPTNRVLWAKGLSHMVRVELDHLGAAVPTPSVKLARLETGGQTFDLTAGRAVVPGVWPFGRRPVGFEYSAGIFEPGADVRFQTRLVGWNDEWSEPISTARSTWSGLPPGDYRFEVRASDRLQRRTPVSTFEFVIRPPWYRTGWAWGGYAALAVLGVLGFTRWRVSRAEAKSRELEELVKVRTQELAAAKNAAEEASRAKSRFLANMSHELRTPLNGILGFAQILARDPDVNDRNRGRLRVIRSSGDHLLGLINDVLDLARVEAGRVELRPAPFSLRDLLRDVEASFASRALQRGLTLEVVMDSIPDGAVLGDQQRLRQVLENLVGNALKFTQRGGVTLTCSSRREEALEKLEVGSRKSELKPDSSEPPSIHHQLSTINLCFSVSDTGPGMSADDVARLFQPFSQAVSGRPPEQGAGLGLAISQHLVGLMGGRIEVSSEVGQGGRFAFTIPFTRTDGKVAGAVLMRRVVGYDGERRRILIVDDLEVNRRLLREFLEPLGFEITEATTGEQALALVGQAASLPGAAGFQPASYEADSAAGTMPGSPDRQDARPPAYDLVILDLRMPGMDGFELTRRLQSLPGFTARVVATSASVFGFNRDDAVRAGANEFLPKPFKEEQLFELLQHQLRLRWRYAEEPASEPVEALKDANGSTVQPCNLSTLPTALLEPLRAAANRGDILAVRRELAAFRERTPEHAAVLAELESLAASFQMTALRQRLTLPAESYG